MLRFAVVGNPISHSRSPLIHSLFAEQTGRRLQYTREEVAVAGFEDFVWKFFAGGGTGLNITVPFKEKAFALASDHSDRAQQAEAVNTLLLNQAGQLYGDNTDGVGLIRDLKENNRIEVTGRRILIAGAGGAVRGILPSLAAEQPAAITLMNRTRAKAEVLQRKFTGLVSIDVKDFDDPISPPFDLIINGTSTGLHGGTPPLAVSLVGSNTCCYDMVYGSKATPFVRWATEAGACRAVDGLGMLVEQAAEAFKIWHGVRPITDEVIRQIRASLGQEER